MRFFVCLVDTKNRRTPDTVTRNHESMPRSRRLEFQWHLKGSMSALFGGDDFGGDPLVVGEGEAVAVGIARLDNRLEVEQWSAFHGPRQLTDLELILRTVLRHGTRCIPQLLGDFAFVIWDEVSRTAVAACDALGVRKMYYCEQDGLFSFASRAEMMAVAGRYNVQYLAELVAACVPSPELSVYAGVNSLPAGTMAVVEHGRLTTHRYWSAYDFKMEPAWAKSEREAAKECRQLLATSVRLRITSAGDTWAQLSGGLDSSSIVSVAEWLSTHGEIPCGLAGTITFVDTHGTGADEREYSHAVVNQSGIRNEQLVDSPVWRDDRCAPPATDHPTVSMIHYPRDCQLCSVVRNAGGRVLLSGGGGDALFTGNMFFFADWLSHGRLWTTAREMARRSAIGRVSFWELAYRNTLLPFLPGAVQSRLVQDPGQMPAWMSRATVRRYDLRRRTFVPRSYRGRMGSKYHDAVVLSVAGIPGSLTYGVVEDALEVRYPYLYRPLVEFALRLPPELCARANARKWVLREAMRGILPDIVRTRVGKGAPYGLLAWSLAAQRDLLQPLVEESILADLGVVNLTRLRAAFQAAQHGHNTRQMLHASLQQTLAIEAWLQMRSGRWPPGNNPN